jgi:uncharacterized integral membrane protein
MRNPGKLVIGFLALLVALVIVIFVLANRTIVEVSFAPLPWTSNPYPLWAVIMVFFALGALLGGLFVWASAHKSRKVSAQRKRRIKALEKELSSAHVQIGSLEAEAHKQHVAAARPAALVEDQSAA